MHFHFPWIVEIHHWPRCAREEGKKKKNWYAVELTIKVARGRNKTNPCWRKMRNRKQQLERRGRGWMKRGDGTEENRKIGGGRKGRKFERDEK